MQKLVIQSRKQLSKYKFLLPDSLDDKDVMKISPKNQNYNLNKTKIMAGTCKETAASKKKVKKIGKFQCTLCNLRYDRKYVLKRHYQSKIHFENLRKLNTSHKYRCAYCLVTFASKSELDAHNKTEKHLNRYKQLHIINKKVISSNTGKFKCQWGTCNFISKNFQEFCQHVALHATNYEHVVIPSTVTNDNGGCKSPGKKTKSNTPIQNVKLHLRNKMFAKPNTIGNDDKNSNDTMADSVHWRRPASSTEDSDDGNSIAYV